MRTNVEIDDELLAKSMKLTKCRTKKEVINLSLAELVKRKERKKILELPGKVIWEGNLSKIRGDIK